MYNHVPYAAPAEVAPKIYCSSGTAGANEEIATRRGVR